MIGGRGGGRGGFQQRDMGPPDTVLGGYTLRFHPPQHQLTYVDNVFCRNRLFPTRR